MQFYYITSSACTLSATKTLNWYNLSLSPIYITLQSCQLVKTRTTIDLLQEMLYWEKYTCPCTHYSDVRVWATCMELLSYEHVSAEWVCVRESVCEGKWSLVRESKRVWGKVMCAWERVGCGGWGCLKEVCVKVVQVCEEAWGCMMEGEVCEGNVDVRVKKNEMWAYANVMVR